MKKKVSFLLCVVLCFLSVASTAAQGYTRSITGEFSGIQISVNNISMPLAREPFVYEGEVYVPIKNLSQWLYLNTKYNEAKRTVEISTGGLLKDATAKVFAGSLLQRDYEIQTLNQQIQQKDKKIVETSNLPYRKITSDGEMEGYLQDHLGELRGIPMTIDFRHYSGNRYRLYITFPSRYREDFEYLSRREVEEWLDDMLYAVRNLYDDRGRIDGHVRDNASSYRTYISFETSGDYLTFNFRYYNSSSSRDRINIDESRLEKRLKDNLSTYSSVDFQYEVTANRYDIDLVVYFDDKDFYDWSSSTQRNYLNRLEREIWNFDSKLDVYGKIIDKDKNDEVLRFHFMDRRVDSYDYVPKTTTSTPKEEVAAVVANPVVRRNVNAWFNRIGLEIDGVPFTLLKEAFMVDEEIYLPITDLADALYWVFEYIPEESALKITDNNFQSKDYLSLGSDLLKNREQEKERLLTELEIRKEEEERGIRTSLPYRNITSVSRMQTYLRDYFEDFEGIEMYISFSRSSNNDYRLRITYPTEDFDDFDNIRRATIEGWLEDMFHAVRDLYDPYARISGTIRSTPHDSSQYTHITFDTSRDRLNFDFDEHGNQTTTSRSIDARKLERELDRYLRRFRGANFRYEVIVNRRDVDLNISCTNDSFSRWDIYDKMDYLQELREEIFSVYDGISVNGRILDSNDRDAFRFSIEKGNIRSFDLMQDLEKYLNRNYKEYGSLNFTYKLWEKDANSFDVKLEGDFFKEENSWKAIAGDDARLESFENFLKDTLKFISNFWEIDVKGEVVDKAYSSLTVKTVEY